MRKLLILIGCVALLGATLACSAGSGGITPTDTLIPPPATATSAPVTVIVSATSAVPTLIPTIAPPTQAPTQAQPAAPTPTRIAQGEPTSVGVSRVKIYLVAVGDNGQSGPKIGCEDSMVGVDRDITPTRAPLTAALNQLLALKDEFYGQSGLRNALFASNLTLDKVTIDDKGLATINLSGTISLAGECDNPRFEAQIVYTAKQFSTVKDVAVFINGKSMQEAIGLK